MMGFMMICGVQTVISKISHIWAKHPDSDHRINFIAKIKLNCDCFSTCKLFTEETASWDKHVLKNFWAQVPGEVSQQVLPRNLYVTNVKMWCFWPILIRATDSKTVFFLQVWGVLSKIWSRSRALHHSSPLLLVCVGKVNYNGSNEEDQFPQGD